MTWTRGSAERYADLLPGDDDEPWGPSAEAFLDALAVLTALREEGWRVVRTEETVVKPVPFSYKQDRIVEEWAQ